MSRITLRLNRYPQEALHEIFFIILGRIKGYFCIYPHLSREISVCQNKRLTIIISVDSQSFLDSCKCFPLSGFKLCFLTKRISLLSADDKTISVFLHGTSPSERQEQQHKSGNIIIYYLSFTKRSHLLLLVI